MTFAVKSIDDLLALKPGGHYRIEAVAGRQVITVHRVGEPLEVIFCLSAGHANQVRLALSDEGLAGFVVGSA